MEKQLKFPQEKSQRVEPDFREPKETVETNKETGLIVVLLMKDIVVILMKDIDSLRSEMRWMVGIMITVFVSLMILTITIILTLLL